MRLLRRLAYLLRWRRHDRELAEELAFHEAMAGRRAMGNMRLAREDARAVWIAPWIESVGQDLRIGARVLRRTPIATLVAATTMTLGIGANTALYALIDSALLRTLPVADADRVVFCTRTTTAGVAPRDFTQRTFEVLRDNNRTLDALAAYDDSRINATIDGRAEMVLGDFVSGDYFQVLRTRAALGRLLRPSDDRPGSPGVLVISDEYWRARFGSEATVAGRTVYLGGLPFTIVGVTAPTFHGRHVSGRSADITVPLMAHAALALHDHTTFGLAGLLKPGTTLAQASADLDGIYRRIPVTDREASDSDAGQRRVGLSTGLYGELGGALGPNDRRQLLTITAIVAFVLALACVNVATLQLARGAARRREMAVRVSLGAGGTRLLRQLLTESLLLAALGGAGALLVARSTAGLLLHALPLPDMTFDPWRDAGTLAFTAAISVASGLLFGLAPALAARRLDVNAILKGSAVHRTATAWRNRSGEALLVAQVALSIALLLATGMLVRSVVNLQRLNPGVTADRVLETDVYPALLRYDRARENQLYRTLTDALGRTPGIDSAAVVRYALFHAGVNYASARLFATLGVPFTDGHDMTDADVASRARVAVINEPAASRWFPGERAVGRTVPRDFTDGLGPLTIIGVVPPINPSYRARPLQPSIFVPYTLASDENLGQASLYIRTRTPARSAVTAVRGAVHDVEPQLALLDLRPLSAELDESIAPQRATAALLGLCGTLALILVALGLYGTMSQAVARRTRELGIRLSLGARPSAIQTMVMKEAWSIAAIGLLAGLPLGVAASRGLSHLLFGVGPADPLTLAATALVTIAVVAAAALPPARRAAHLDPLIALRSE